MASTEPFPDDREFYRREAMGAFAHEVRTPLTSIRMVLELARRQAEDGQLILDDELAGMLRTSVDDLQRLADDLQEASRLERGKLVLSNGPCDLGAAIDAARDLVFPAVTLSGPAPDAIEGRWDVPQLVRALAGFAMTANRIGDGGGTVSIATLLTARAVRCVFTSGGSATGAWRPLAADAGFAFFRSRDFVLAMGGTVNCERADRFCRIVVELPL
jgi:signal transduction histidine kinase